MYNKSESSQFCSASLNAGSEPNTADLCNAAIQFNRSLRSHLHQAVLENPTIPFDLRNSEGLESVKSYDEKCAPSAEQFSWVIDRSNQLFDVRLEPVSEVKAPMLSYAGYSRGAGYRFSIYRRFLK